MLFQKSNTIIMLEIFNIIFLIISIIVGLILILSGYDPAPYQESFSPIDDFFASVTNLLASLQIVIGILFIVFGIFNFLIVKMFTKWAFDAHLTRQGVFLILANLDINGPEQISSSSSSTKRKNITQSHDL
jgi:hypothetical protein